MTAFPLLSNLFRLPERGILLWLAFLGLYFYCFQFLSDVGVLTWICPYLLFTFGCISIITSIKMRFYPFAKENWIGAISSVEQIKVLLLTLVLASSFMVILCQNIVWGDYYFLDSQHFFKPLSTSNEPGFPLALNMFLSLALAFPLVYRYQKWICRKHCDLSPADATRDVRIAQSAFLATASSNCFVSPLLVAVFLLICGLGRESVDCLDLKAAKTALTFVSVFCLFPQLFVLMLSMGVASNFWKQLRAATLLMAGCFSFAALTMHLAFPLGLHEFWMTSLRLSGRYTAAMKEVNILIAKDPLEGRYYHSRGEMLNEIGQLPAALESLRKSRELGCSYRCIYNHLVIDARMHNNYREVIALCDEYIERNSTDSYSLTMRGDAFDRLGDKARAIEDFKAVVSKQPESADQYSDLSYALDHLGRKQEALAAIDEAIRRQPAEVGYRCQRSHLLIALGRYRDAITETDTLLKKDPECVGGLCNAGVAMYKLGLTRMALANLNKSIGIYPLETALYYRSKIHESMGDFRAAELDRAKYKSMGFDPSRREF